MYTIDLQGYMTVDLRNWLFKNIGPIDDTWSLTFDNKLVFKKESDATYFTMMFYEKLQEQKKQAENMYWYRQLRTRLI